MFTESERYYRSSGAVPIVGLLLAVSGTLGAVAVLATIYALISIYIPVVYFKFIATVGYGMFTGKILRSGLTAGMVRNRTVAQTLAVGMGVVAVYAAWVAFIWALGRKDGVSILAFSLPDLSAWMAHFSESGLWEMSDGERPTGLVLESIWLIEAILIVGGTVTPFLAADLPYCENCSQWAHSQLVNTKFAIPDDPQGLVRDLEDEQYESLAKLSGAPDDIGHFLLAAVHSCPNCNHHWLTLIRVALQKAAKWDAEVVLPQNLVISKGEADKLLALGPTEIEDDDPQEIDAD